MAKKSKEARINEEIAKLDKIFAPIDANKKVVVKTLIDRAAFITVSLQDVEKQLEETGWVETYQNGQNQSGVKKSSIGDVHISLTKNLSTLIKQLIDLVPPAERTREMFDLD